MNLLGEAAILGGSARTGKTAFSSLPVSAGESLGREICEVALNRLCAQFAFPHPLSADLRLEKRKLSGGKVDSEERDGSMGDFPQSKIPEGVLEAASSRGKVLWAPGVLQSRLLLEQAQNFSSACCHGKQPFTEPS